MAKTCIACGKTIGMLTVRIPLLDNEDLCICASCFEKMPSALDDLYQKKIFPFQEELVEMKEEILQDIKFKGFNVDTQNLVAKFMDEKIENAPKSLGEDEGKVKKVCPICKRKTTYESDSCSNCGYVFVSDIKLKSNEIAEIYNKRLEQYKNNPFYEYDYIVVRNNQDGSVNQEKVAKIIEEHAFQGWRLISMYSNEIGKEAIGGINATICEDVLVFERCIKGRS